MVSIAQKIVRAGLVGLTIGIIAGLGFYFMTTAINMIAAPAPAVFDPIAMMILVFGFVTVAAIAVELSADISEKQNQATKTPTLTYDIGPNLVTAFSDLKAQIQAEQGRKKTEDGPPASKTAT